MNAKSLVQPQNFLFKRRWRGWHLHKSGRTRTAIATSGTCAGMVSVGTWTTTGSATISTLTIGLSVPATFFISHLLMGFILNFLSILPAFFLFRLFFQKEKRIFYYQAILPPKQFAKRILLNLILQKPVLNISAFRPYQHNLLLQ